MSDQNIITRGVPSVQTRVTGSETTKAIIQAIVIMFTIGITLSAIYLSIYSVMTPERWQLAFQGLGLLAGLTLFIKWFEWHEGMEGDGNFPRVTAFIGNVLVNSWIWAPVAAYEMLIAPSLVSITGTAPHIVVMFVWVLSLIIAAGFLIYRLASELFDPLSGNAIEIVTKRIDVSFSKWKIEHDDNVSSLKRQIEKLKAERDERDKIIANLQAIKRPTLDISQSIKRIRENGRIKFLALARGKDRELDPALLARFVIDGFGGVGFNRNAWANVGVGRDDWEAMKNALIPWAIDEHGKPIMSMGKVIRELEAYGIPLPHLDDVEQTGTGTSDAKMPGQDTGTGIFEPVGG